MSRVRDTRDVTPSDAKRILSDGDFAFALELQQQQEAQIRTTDIKQQERKQRSLEERDFELARELQQREEQKRATRAIQISAPRRTGRAQTSLLSVFFNALLGLDSSSYQEEPIFAAQVASLADRKQPSDSSDDLETKEINPKTLSPFEFFKRNFELEAYFLPVYYELKQGAGGCCIVKEKKGKNAPEPQNQLDFRAFLKARIANQYVAVFDKNPEPQWTFHKITSVDAVSPEAKREEIERQQQQQNYQDVDILSFLTSHIDPLLQAYVFTAQGIRSSLPVLSPEQEEKMGDELINDLLATLFKIPVTIGEADAESRIDDLFDLLKLFPDRDGLRECPYTRKKFKLADIKPANGTLQKIKFRALAIAKPNDFIAQLIPLTQEERQARLIHLNIPSIVNLLMAVLQAKDSSPLVDHTVTIAILQAMIAAKAQPFAQWEEPEDCDLLTMSGSLDKKTIDNLPIRSKAAYIRIDKPSRLFYINLNQAKKECIDIKLTPEELKRFDDGLIPKSTARTLKKAELEQATVIARHTQSEKVIFLKTLSGLPIVERIPVFFQAWGNKISDIPQWIRENASLVMHAFSSSDIETLLEAVDRQVRIADVPSFVRDFTCLSEAKQLQEFTQLSAEEKGKILVYLSSPDEHKKIEGSLGYKQNQFYTLVDLMLGEHDFKAADAKKDVPLISALLLYADPQSLADKLQRRFLNVRECVESLRKYIPQITHPTLQLSFRKLINNLQASKVSLLHSRSTPSPVMTMSQEVAREEKNADIEAIIHLSSGLAENKTEFKSVPALQKQLALSLLSDQKKSEKFKKNSGYEQKNFRLLVGHLFEEYCERNAANSERNKTLLMALFLHVHPNEQDKLLLEIFKSGQACIAFLEKNAITGDLVKNCRRLLSNLALTKKPIVLREQRKELDAQLEREEKEEEEEEEEDEDEDGMLSILSEQKHLLPANNLSALEVGGVGVAGGITGLAGGMVLSHYYATTSTAGAAATIFGVKVGIFIATSTVVGILFFLLIAAATYCFRRCYPGFFSRNQRDNNPDQSVVEPSNNNNRRPSVVVL